MGLTTDDMKIFQKYIYNFYNFCKLEKYPEDIEYSKDLENVLGHFESEIPETLRTEGPCEWKAEG